MSDFVRVLNSFRAGVLSQAELLSEVDRQLADGRANPTRLMHALSEEQARAGLPDNTHIAIARRLMQWHESVWAASADTRPPEQFVRPILDSAVTVTILDDGLLPEATLVANDSPMISPQLAVVPVTAGRILQGRFKLLDEVGHGGMSTVFKAIDLRRVEARAPDPHVAVKILTVPLKGFTRSLALLQSEAHKLQSLPHPNIVRVIDCDRDGATVFMTMELLSGQSLSSRITAARERNASSIDASKVINSIGAALEFAHENGIVHGDLKPGNVIVTDRGDVKVIDFGIARLMNRAHSDTGRTILEQEGVSAFTPRYASPQVLERKEPEPADDVYALACIAHEALTGRHPYEGKTAIDAHALGMKVARHPTMSRGQFRAICRGLEFDRQKRIPTAHAFVDEFHSTQSRKTARTAALACGAVAAILLVAYLMGISGFGASRETPLPALVATPPAIGKMFRDCPTCPLMTAIPSGQFVQGAADSDPDATPLERPTHPVNIPHPLGVGIYEITVGEFKDFVMASGYKTGGCATYDGEWRTDAQLGWSSVGFDQSASHPVTCVSWRDANEYAQWLSGKTGNRYRLPSASEWEYAARAGVTSSQPWQSATQSCTFANVADAVAARHFPGWNAQACDDGQVFTAPVGSFSPNAFGLHDTLGNVSEWTADCWHDSYRGAPRDGSAWIAGGDCGLHEMRGGSWFTAPANVSLAARNRFDADYRSNSAGFRLVREIDQ